MNQLKKVSIIVPMYNVAEYIAQTLASIAGQTYQNYEVILINDGSTDTTAAVVHAIIGTDQRYQLKTISNAGPGHARNQGIDQSSGEFVLFLDSDDYLARDALALLVEAMEASSVDLVLGKTLRFNEEKEWEVPSHKKYQLNQPGKKSVVQHPELFYAIGPAAKLYRRQLVLANRFSENSQFAEDQSFVFGCYVLAEEVYVLAEVVYYYRVRSGDNQSLTQTYRQDVLTNVTTIIAIMASSLALLRKTNQTEENLTKLLEGYYNRLCEIELRVLLKANLLAKSSVQQAVYAQMVDLLNTPRLASHLTQCPAFAKYLLAEQLSFFFLVKKASYPTYFTLLKSVAQYQINQAEQEAQLGAVLATENKYVARQSLKLRTLSRHLLRKLDGRQV